MSLSGPYGDMYRDPYEQQHIVAEMTGHIERDPTHAQGYFRRGNAFSNLGQYDRPSKVWTRCSRFSLITPWLTTIGV